MHRSSSVTSPIEILSSRITAKSFHICKRIWGKIMKSLLDIGQVPGNNGRRALLWRIMRQRRVRSTCRNIFVCQTHEVLILSPIFREPPRGLVLSDLIPFSQLALKPSKESHEGDTITKICSLHAFDLRLVLHAHHMFDVGWCDCVPERSQHQGDGIRRLRGNENSTITPFPPAKKRPNVSIAPLFDTNRVEIVDNFGNQFLWFNKKNSAIEANE